ncbi:class I histocompatibility antigen, F10 alpha chain-like isoform X2 [Pantherophis guttatus]|uniref:Class I histocompatibility antigen, F10 alpha chain-like isoform X2 n=1 Tax=Pantherophis guttatus TaxID=94885 RepID=A0ABM3YZT6_PANGU|nr:class I histocompatibility antigen, F10 alpha chain-like isoform X2 [Pantherophis guttatus]XP_060541633.1 class I histocompatibility antigen, F10 alpha chain-like isoform X2 [Pantherophis guttatus]
MALRSAPFLLLVLVSVALGENRFGASSHSMKYFSTAIWDPGQGLPHFVTVGYVDGQVFVHYDSHSRRMKPRVSWMEKVGKEDPQYWDTETQKARGHEEVFREDLKILRNRYNQSEGLHIIQWMSGCELWRDGSKGGFNQHGYDGRNFITFDKETLTWVAPDPQAQITQRKWDAVPGWNQGWKTYLEGECIEWLEKYLSYGNETLLRTEPPVVTVSRRKVKDGMEMRVCRVDGFYPRAIDASWRRDGEVWLQGTSNRSVAPNMDGTYHYWLSIQINPKERDHYRCHVEHDGLQEPLDVAIKDPPVVTVSRTDDKDAMEVHVCHMDGFYPREIDASWTRDGEVWLQDTFRGSMIPNVDGTYHYWLSIQIDPKERDRYRCHVEHDGLEEPLDVSLKGETLQESNLGLIIGCIGAALALVCVIVGTLIFFKKRRNGYKAASAKRLTDFPIFFSFYSSKRQRI